MPPCRWTSSSITCRIQHGCALIYTMVSCGTYAIDLVDGSVLKSRLTSCYRPSHAAAAEAVMRAVSDPSIQDKSRLQMKVNFPEVGAIIAVIASLHQFAPYHLHYAPMHTGQPSLRHLPHRHSTGDGAHDRPPTRRAARVTGAGLRATEFGRRCGGRGHHLDAV